MSSIGPVVSEKKMFENVDRRRTTDDRQRSDDGRWSHWYTISSPMSLRRLIGEIIITIYIGYFITKCKLNLFLKREHNKND